MKAEEIRAKRIELELTQVELGTRLGVAGNTIARWERGELAVEHPEMLRLALSALSEQVGNRQKRGGAERRNAQLQAETMDNLQKAGEIIERIKNR